MKIKVRLFAAARQLAQRDELIVECSDSPTVAELRQAVVSTLPQLESLLAHVRFAVNASYVDDAAPLKVDDDVACIPPVSGG